MSKYMTKEEYANYCNTHDSRYGDPLSFKKCKQLLKLLNGETIYSTDGCYSYRVKAGKLHYQGEALGATLYDGLVGWVGKAENVDDLLNELDADGNVERSLWVSGMLNQ